MMLHLAVPIPDPVLEDWEWTPEQIADQLAERVREVVIKTVIDLRVSEGLHGLPVVERPPF